MVAIAAAMFIALFGWGHDYFHWSDPSGRVQLALFTSFILGIICGSAIGASVSWLTGFPISLPWWSFAIGLGFSACVGIFFGMVPAIRASRLDPIDALRHE